MKRLKIITLIVLGISIFSACKKDYADQPISLSLQHGIYEGKYGTGNNTPTVFFSFSIKPNGVLEEIDQTGAILGTGVWTITENIFYGTSNYLPPATNKFAVTATYDAAAKKLTGTWGYGNKDADGGKWHMTKKIRIR